MGVERYVVEAVVLEGRSRREVARSTGLSKAWVDKLVARYNVGGREALTPRSRRPLSCPHAASTDVQPPSWSCATSSARRASTMARIPSPNISASASPTSRRCHHLAHPPA
jgi:hypothetical protein